MHACNCNSSRCNWNRPNQPKVALPAVQVARLLPHWIRLKAALVSMHASLGWWMRWLFPALFFSNLDPRVCFLMILIVGNWKNQLVWASLQSCTRSFPLICMKLCRSTPVFVIPYVLNIRVLLILICPKFVKKLDNHIRKIAMSFFLLISPFFVLLTIIRQKKGTGFSPFSSFFQKAEKDSEVSFFFLFYDLLYFNSFNTLYSSLRIP